MFTNWANASEYQAEHLGNRIRYIADHLPPDGVTLAEIRDLIGQDGLLIFTIFLTTVFMIPVSIPGVSTVFGSAILLIGIHRLFRRNLWLPKFIAHRSFPSDKLRAGLNRGSVWLNRLERLSHPHRLSRLATTGFSDTVNSLALIGGAVLLMAPFGFVPFSNTLPALAILLLAVGLLQRDGLCILLGHFANLATLVYFVILLTGGGLVLRELFHYLIR